jgi:1-acyl-sn-glycerol-3-phosphate acyltransferase
VINIHVLDPVPTAGLTYEDRDELAERVHAAMRTALREKYGVSEQ